MAPTGKNVMPACLGIYSGVGKTEQLLHTRMSSW